MTKEEKVKAYDLLVSKTQEMGEMLCNIEDRLFDYYEDIALNIEYHNAYEILGALKFLRLLRTYQTDIETFRDVVYKYEGIWEQRDGIWKSWWEATPHHTFTIPLDRYITWRQPYSFSLGLKINFPKR